MTRRVEAKAWAVASSVSFVAVVSAASPVRASERAPFFLEYAAAPGCPDRHAWLEEVSRRSSRVVPASANERAPTLRVELTQLADRVRAELAAIDVGGRETRRTVFASNCREAVEGSAWIAAVWLDPSLRPQGPALPIPPAPPPPPAPPATRAQPIAPIADDPNPGARATRETARSARATPVRLEANVQLGSFMTALPDTPLGFAAFLGVSAWPRTLLAPVLRWGYVAAGEGTTRTERGDVDVSLGMMRGLGCVFALKASPVTLRPCALFELGHLEGRGENTTLPTAETGAWRSVGALARAEFRIASILSLDAEAGVVFPLARDRFVFGPSPPVVGFAVPAIAGTLSLGLSVGASVGGPISTEQ